MSRPMIWSCFLAVTQSLVVACEDDTGSWTQLSGVRERLCVWGSGSDDVYAVGTAIDGVTVIHYDGQNWKSKDTGLEMPTLGVKKFSGVWGTSPSSVFACYSEYLFTFDGISWSRPSATLSESGDCRLWGTSSTNIFLVYEHSDNIIRFDGNSFIKVHTMAGAELNNIWGSSSDDIFAVGVFGSSPNQKTLVLHYDGTSWTKMKADFDTLYGLRGVRGTGAKDVYAYGGDGQNNLLMLHYDGVAWKKNNAPQKDLHSTGGFSVTLGGRIVLVDWSFAFEYEGTEWNEIDTGGLHLNDVWVSPRNDVYAVGEEGVFKMEN